MTLSAPEANGLEGFALALPEAPVEGVGAMDEDVEAAAIILMGIVVLTLVSREMKITWKRVICLVTD